MEELINNLIEDKTFYFRSLIMLEARQIAGLTQGVNKDNINDRTKEILKQIASKL